MRMILVLLMAGVLAASAVAASDGIGLGNPQQSVWESLRDQLDTAIECEREARELPKLGKIRKKIRECDEHLQKAQVEINRYNDEVRPEEGFRPLEVADALRSARARDSEVTGQKPITRFPPAPTRAEARRFINLALVEKYRALAALEAELGYTVEVRNSAMAPDDDDYRVGASGEGREVNELWFTSPAPIAATSGVAVAEPTGAFRFVSGEALSPRVYRLCWRNRCFRRRRSSSPSRASRPGRASSSTSSRTTTASSASR